MRKLRIRKLKKNQARIWLGIILGLLIIGGFVVYRSLAADPGLGCSARNTRENAVFWYQAMPDDLDLSQFGCPQLFVTSTDLTSSQLINLDTYNGAGAYRYVQSFWFGANTGVQYGVDTNANMNWAFCSTGTTPRQGNYPGSNHPTWYYVDNNSAAVVAAFKSYLAGLKATGFDGVFLDIGGQAMVYGEIWDKKSSCTRDPISTTATAADAYTNLINVAHSVGLKVFVNGGAAPNLSPLRPNPRSSACIQKLPTCVPLDDVLGKADYVLHEGASNELDDTNWQNDILALASDQAIRFGSNTTRQHAKVIVMGRYAGPENSTREAHIVYQWAKMKLFYLMANFGTGTDGGGGNRHGIAPEALVTLQLGSPLAPSTGPGKVVCEADGWHCMYYRRYNNGMVLVNNTSTSKEAGSIPLFDDGSCRYVTNVITKFKLSKNCIRSISPALPPFSGLVVSYSIPTTTK